MKKERGGKGRMSCEKRKGGKTHTRPSHARARHDKSPEQIRAKCDDLTDWRSHTGKTKRERERERERDDCRVF